MTIGRNRSNSTKFPVFSLLSREFACQNRRDGFAADCLHRHDSSSGYCSVFQVFGGAEFAPLPGGLGPMCIGPMVP